MDNTSQKDSLEVSSLNKSFWKKVSERLGIDHLSYSLPAHAQSLLYMLGGLTFTTFMVLFVSGIYLAQFYNPNQLSSYQSVLYLVSTAPFGNFMRSVHYWASSTVFVLIIVHMTRVFITGSYKKPREFTWLLGLSLAVLAVLFLFAGTMLSLGQEGIEAIEHYNEIGALLGPIGLWFTSGFGASIPLIGRVYVEHMVILPLTFVVLVFVHFYLVHVHNVSPKATKNAVVGYDDSEGTVPFISHVKKLAGWSFILIAIISTLAILFPETVEHVGVAGVPLHEVKPRWMFLWLFGIEDVFGIGALIWAPAAILGLLAIIPFIDRSKYIHWSKRPWIMVYGAVMAIVIILFSLQAIFAKPMPTPQVSSRLPLIDYILPGKIAYAHDIVFFSFTPTTVNSGDVVDIKSDGMHKTGKYGLYLIGIKGTVSIGSVIIPKGEDSFNIKVVIPSGIDSGLYTIEAKNIKEGTTYYAPLQISIGSVSMPTLKQYPNDTRYPIPPNEIPWIVGTIAILTVAGVYLLYKK